MPFRCLLLAAGLSALLAGCGSENAALIPRDDADRISALVAEAGDASGAGECDTARQAVRQADQQLSGLPRKTDKNLKANLRDWIDYLDRQIAGRNARPRPRRRRPRRRRPRRPRPPTPTDRRPSETETPTPTPTPTPEPTATVDPGTGGEQGPPEEPPGTGGVPPGEDG